MPEHNQ